MSDTPETNSIIRNAQAADHPPTRLAATLTVKCEKLERERDEAMELLASEKITRNHIIKRSVEVERERDEAREKAERYRREANKFMLQRDESQEKYATEATEHMLAVNKICNERDEAMENLDQEIKFHHRTHSELVKANCILLNIEYDKLKS